MKVLVCSSYRPDMVDGASVSGRNLVRELRKAGCDVTVCTTDLGWPRNLIGATRKDCLMFHAYFSHILEIAPGLIGFFAREMRHFNVVHFRGLFSLSTIIGSFFARRLGKPYIVSPVGDRIPSWKERTAVSNGWIKYVYSRLLISPTLKGAAHIECTSEMERDQVTVQLNLPEARVGVIPNGVDIASYATPAARALLEIKLGIKPETTPFLYLGRLSKEKALEFLIAAWENVIRQRKHSVLVMAGGNEINAAYVELLKGQVRSSWFSNSVLFPGSVSGELKNALLQHSCCLLLPSYRESFGNVVLEALASGTPVLASEGTPWKCLPAKGCGHWLPWDADRWAKAMIEQGDSWKLGREKGALAGPQWVIENFSWERVAARYADVYRQAAKPDPKSSAD
jgi:glycosyltransferase involved in cell wall biosynthesis